MINRSFRGPSASRTLAVLCLLTLAIATVGCSSKTKRDDPGKLYLNPDNPFRAGTDIATGAVPQSETALKAEAARAYFKAHSLLLNTDYESATEQYTQLIARYPFTEYATQAELEKVFAQYRSFKPDEALLGADRFLREHPRHKHADYLHYLKGLINSARTESISDFLPLDTSKKDVNAERRAYDDFAVLVQRFPQSVYAGDARKRMIFLRNRIARHELSIVQFYVKRQAWVAVAKRAENLIAEYPGAPATAEALRLLKLSYDKLDLKPQIADVGRIIAANDEVLRLGDIKRVEPGPRSRIGFPDEPAVAAAPSLAAPTLVDASPPSAPATTGTPAAAASAAAAAEPKGFFGRIAAALDKLNGSYTLDADQVKDSKAPQPPGGERPSPTPAAVDSPTTAAETPAVRPSTRNPERQNSLTTGPYFEDVQVDVRPVFGDGETPAAPAPATPEPAAAVVPPASAADAAAAPTADAAASAESAPKKKKKKKGFFGWIESLSGSYTVEDGKVVETPGETPAAEADTTSDKAPEPTPAN